MRLKRVSRILAEFPETKEMDINPMRLFKDGSGVCVLDARIVMKKGWSVHQYLAASHLCENHRIQFGVHLQFSAG
jgi:hypothetical protein